MTKSNQVLLDTEGSVVEQGGGRDISHGSVLNHITVVSLGCVVTDEINGDTRSESDDSGNDRDSSPRLLGISIEDVLEEGEESGTHHKLSDTTSKISPSSTKGVGGSDDLTGEHAARPELTHDEGTSSNTNEETKNGESSGSFDQSGHGGRDGGEAKDDSHQDTGSVLVTGGSKDETHKDSSSNPNNRGSPDFFLGESESVADLREQRSDGEPDEKSNKETPPRAMESTHVRP